MAGRPSCRDDIFYDIKLRTAEIIQVHQRLHCSTDNVRYCW